MSLTEIAHVFFLENFKSLASTNSATPAPAPPPLNVPPAD
jgi:hypothetical protein